MMTIPYAVTSRISSKYFKEFFQYTKVTRKDGHSRKLPKPHQQSELDHPSQCNGHPVGGTPLPSKQS
jgi:hypothetical protein